MSMVGAVYSLTCPRAPTNARVTRAASPWLWTRGSGRRGDRGVGVTLAAGPADCPPPPPVSPLYTVLWLWVAIHGRAWMEGSIFFLEIPEFLEEDEFLVVISRSKRARYLPLLPLFLLLKYEITEFGPVLLFHVM